MRVELPRPTLELAIAALKSVSINTHELAAEAASESLLLRAAVLRAAADQADAAAEEIHRAMHDSPDRDA